MPTNDKKKPDSINIPPFETEDLRRNLAAFLDADFHDPVAGRIVKVGNFKWGVYMLPLSKGGIHSIGHLARR